MAKMNKDINKFLWLSVGTFVALLLSVFLISSAARAATKQPDVTAIASGQQVSAPTTKTASVKPQSAAPTTPNVPTEVTSVNNESELDAALAAIPTDGSSHTLGFASDFTTANGWGVNKGQNVTFINQNGIRTISLSKAISINSGAIAAFKGDEANGITFTPSPTFSADQALYVGGTATMENTTVANFVITPSYAFNNGAVKILGGHLTLNNGATIYNNQIVSNNGGDIADSAGGVMVDRGGTLTMNAGSYVWRNVTPLDQSQGNVGGVAVHTGSTFVMNGGTVQENYGASAGGILVGDVNKNVDPDVAASAFVMNDGDITGNGGWNSAGGLLIHGNGIVTINSGRITKNSAGALFGGNNPIAAGGGIAVDTGYSYGMNADYLNQHNAAKLTINDAVIDDNQSSNVGGGIYVNSNNVTINKAQITNNTALSHGGGIYLSIAEYTLHLGKTLVTRNAAVNGPVSPDFSAVLYAGVGGGIWFCPTGSAELNVTDGSAIFGNTAVREGADFASVQKSGNYSVTLSNRMLGGGGAVWIHDRDGNKDTALVTLANYDKTVSLLDTASDTAQARATELATVIITGNKAARGGGIGSNGTIIFGKPETKKITVIKKWADGSKTLPASIKIDLLIDDASSKLDGKVIDTITLAAPNGWTGEFADLPMNQNYKLAEEAVDGYTSSNTGLQDEGNGLYSITFTNTPNTPGVPPITPPVVPPVTPPVPPVPNVPGVPPVKPPVVPPVTPPTVPNKPKHPRITVPPVVPGTPTNHTNTPKTHLPQTNDDQNQIVEVLGMISLSVMLIGFGLRFGKRF